MKSLLLLIALSVVVVMVFAEEQTPSEAWKSGTIDWEIYPPNDGYVLLKASGSNFELELKIESKFFDKNREQIIAATEIMAKELEIDIEKRAKSFISRKS
jgi:hypothetical protein